MYLSDIFPIQSGLKQRVALSPLLFNFAPVYAIRKVQENPVGLRMSGTHQSLTYADGVNLLDDITDTMNRNAETLTGSSKEVGLEINVEKTKYMLVSHHQNAGKNSDIKIVNRPFENMSHFRCVGRTVTNKNQLGRKLRVDSIQVILAIIQSTTFCLLIYSPEL
jgi:hypothetical protein